MSVNVDPSEWAFRTPGGIPYKAVELTGSFGSEDATVTEVILIQASQLLAFVTESFPLTYPFTGTSVSPQRRTLPGLAPLLVKSIRYEGHTEGRPIDPFDGYPDVPANTYEPILKLTIEHGTSPANDDEQDPDDPSTFLEITANAGGVFLAVEPANATWVGIEALGEPKSEAVKEKNIPQTQTEPQTEWSVRWSQIDPDFFDDTLMAKLRDKLGKVNGGAMTTLYNAPAETVLFMGFALREQYTWREGSAGKPPVQMDMKFVEKNLKTPEGVQVTHNHVYRTGKGYRRLLIDGKPLYAETDLDNIFSGQ